MLVQSFFALIFAPLVAGQGCSVCGDGKAITKPDAIFAFPGQPVVACGDLEKAGEEGVVPLSQCGFLPALIKDTCGCEDLDGGCSVCGDGKKVSKPDAIFAFPDQPVVACGALENAGKTGVVPLNECGFLPSLIKDVCGCIPSYQQIAPTSQPDMQQPYQPPSQTSFGKTQKSKGMSTGAVAGIIVGVIAVGGLLIGLVFVSTSRMRKERPIITAEATAVSAAPAPPADAFGTGDSKTAVDDKEMI